MTDKKMNEIGAVRVFKVTYEGVDGKTYGRRVTTKIVKSGAFEYGNGKGGVLTIHNPDGDNKLAFDLRYAYPTEDLHMLMIRDYFGNHIEVNEVSR